MASTRQKKSLFLRIRELAAMSGWRVALLPSPTKHPVALRLISPCRSLDIHANIYELTGDGGPPSRQEYRMETNPLLSTSAQQTSTVFLGYCVDVEVFLGLEAERDILIHAGSQIAIPGEVARLAYMNGFSVHSNKNRKLLVIFRFDYLSWYYQNIECLHLIGKTKAGRDALDVIANSDLQVSQAAIELVPPEHHHAVRDVATSHVAVQFRNRVLVAYNHRCAFCGVTSEPLEAAHIVPASHPESSYETANGVALCASHHRAFDTGLVAFNTQYDVIINESMISDLQKRDRAGGEDQFRENLRKMIILPPATSDRPSAGLVREGLLVRGWPNSAL